MLDRWCEYLVTSSYVDDARPTTDRADLVEQLRAQPDAERMRCGCATRWCATASPTPPGSTNVSTTAGEAWAAGIGVCQDFTHAMLSLLRSSAASRRATCRATCTPRRKRVGETVRGESHAWVEVWNGGWEGLDPTNDRVVGAAHVLVARGRDYADVPPLKGIYAGGASQGLGVDVDITQLKR